MWCVGYGGCAAPAATGGVVCVKCGVCDTGAERGRDGQGERVECGGGRMIKRQIRARVGRAGVVRCAGWVGLRR